MDRETFVFLFPSKCVCVCLFLSYFFPSSNLYYAQISTLKWSWMCSGVKCDGSTLYTRLSACHTHTLENVQFDRMCSTFGIHVHVRNKSFASRIDEPRCVIYISEWHHTVHWYFSYTAFGSHNTESELMGTNSVPLWRGKKRRQQQQRTEEKQLKKMCNLINWYWWMEWCAMYTTHTLYNVQRFCLANRSLMQWTLMKVKQAFKPYGMLTRE